MKRMTIVLGMVILCMAMTLMAQQTPQFNYQGVLKDAGGDPVPDGDYFFVFRIFSDSTGGQPLWSETYPALRVTGGLFSVQLGSVHPCSLDVLGSGPLFLETQIGLGQRPLTPRVRIGMLPSAGISQRISGDVETAPGSLLLQGISGQSIGLYAVPESMGIGVEDMPGANCRRKISMVIDSTGMNLNFGKSNGSKMMEINASCLNGAAMKWHDPTPQPDPPPESPDLLMTAVACSVGASITMFTPGIGQGGEAVAIASGVGGEGNIYLFDPQPEPPARAALAISNNLGNGASIRLFDPQPEPPANDPSLQFRTLPGDESSISMLNPHGGPPGDPLHLLDINSMPNSDVTIRLFDPQPEPPAHDPTMEMRTGPGGVASIYMFDPQPEPPAKLLGIQSSLSGSDISLMAPQAGGAILVNGNPQIRLSCDSTASRFLLQRAWSPGPAPDSTGISMYADSSRGQMDFYNRGEVQLSIQSRSTGTAAHFIDDGSEYMGITPSPFGWGGSLEFYGGGGDPNIVISAAGKISIGTNLQTNILTIAQFSATDPIADAWTTYSSRRWKTNIQPMQGALDKVMRLNGVTFDWKETGKHDIGLIAEDVGQVVPEVVKYEENGVDAQSVDYARLTALLIEAVKEQQKTIDELKSEISEMKANGNIRALIDAGK